jgi:hypothetical protein
LLQIKETENVIEAEASLIWTKAPLQLPELFSQLDELIIPLPVSYSAFPYYGEEEIAKAG